MSTRRGVGKRSPTAQAVVNISSSSSEPSGELQPLSRWAGRASSSSGSSSGESVEAQPVTKWALQTTSSSESSANSAVWKDLVHTVKTEKPLPTSHVRGAEPRSRTRPKPVPSPARKRVLPVTSPPEISPRRRPRTTPEGAAAAAVETPKSTPRASQRSTTTPVQSPSKQRPSGSFSAVSSPPRERSSRHTPQPVTPVSTPRRHTGSRVSDAPQPQPTPPPPRATDQRQRVSGSRRSGRSSGVRSQKALGSSPQPSARRSKKGTAPVKKQTGYKILKEIARLQHSTQTLIPKLPFARLVREILWRITGEHYLMQAIALQVLQEAAEAVLVSVLEGANVLAQHTRRVTLMNRDITTLVRVVKSHGSLAQCLS